MFALNHQRPKRRIINRDPNNDLDLNGLNIQGGPGNSGATRMSISSANSGATTGVRRGLEARARLNYNRMARLGPGESARRLQKDSFSKLKKMGLKNSGTRLNNSGSQSSPSVRPRLDLFK